MFHVVSMKFHQNMTCRCRPRCVPGGALSEKWWSWGGGSTWLDVARRWLDVWLDVARRRLDAPLTYIDQFLHL